MDSKPKLRKMLSGSAQGSYQSTPENTLPRAEPGTPGPEDRESNFSNHVYFHDYHGVPHPSHCPIFFWTDLGWKELGIGVQRPWFQPSQGCWVHLYALYPQITGRSSSVASWVSIGLSSSKGTDTKQDPMTPISWLQEIGVIQPLWPSMSSKQQVQTVANQGRNVEITTVKRDNSAALGQGSESPSRGTHNNIFELSGRYWNPCQVGEINRMLPTRPVGIRRLWYWLAEHTLFEPLLLI